MKLNENYPALATWHSFDNRQRKAVVRYFEGYLGADFGDQMHWGNECHDVRPAGVKRGRRFGELRNYGRDAIGCYADAMMCGLMSIAACHSPVRYHITHVETVKSGGKVYPGLDGHAYHSQAELDEADARYRRFMSGMVDGIAKMQGVSRDEVETGIRGEADPDGFEYNLVCGDELAATYFDRQMAFAEARQATELMFGGYFPGQRIGDHCKGFDSLDFTGDYIIEVPKISYVKWRLQISDLWAITPELPFYDKLVNDRENTEFLKLLETI